MRPRRRASGAERELTPGEVAILGLLAEQPRSGYEISSVVEARGMREWTELAFSSIYAILKRLAAMGLVGATTELVSNRARTRYALTREGRRELGRSVRRLLETPERASNGLDVAVANIANLSPAEARRSLERRRAALQLEIERLDMLREERTAGAPYFVRALFERPLVQLRAEHEWLSSLITRVPDAERR